MEAGRIVTLIGEKLAKEGEEFVFLGMANKCEECRLKKACANLEIGRRYRVVKIREDIRHECYVHEGGVSVVEVIEPPIKAIVDAKYAVKGSKIVFKPVDCEPALHDLSHPAGLVEGDRCVVVDVLDDLPGGLKLVELKRETGYRCS